MTKREMIQEMANYFYWDTESDKEMAIDKIQEVCSQEEIENAFNGIKKEMHNYMAVEIPTYYFQPLYKKATEVK